MQQCGLELHLKATFLLYLMQFLLSFIVDFCAGADILYAFFQKLALS